MARRRRRARGGPWTAPCACSRPASPRAWTRGSSGRPARWTPRPRRWRGGSGSASLFETARLAAWGSADAVEGRRAFLDNRAPSFHGRLTAAQNRRGRDRASWARATARPAVEPVDVLEEEVEGDDERDDPARAPTQLRPTPRLSRYDGDGDGGQAKPHRATCGQGASSLNQPWAKASATSSVTSPRRRRRPAWWRHGVSWLSVAVGAVGAGGSAPARRAVVAGASSRSVRRRRSPRLRRADAPSSRSAPTIEPLVAVYRGWHVVSVEAGDVGVGGRDDVGVARRRRPRSGHAVDETALHRRQDDLVAGRDLVEVGRTAGRTSCGGRRSPSCRAAPASACRGSGRAPA